MSFGFRGRPSTVRDADVDAVARARRLLVSVAERRSTVTYGELVETAELPGPARGQGRLLHLVYLDCVLRDEPPLDALVVAKGTAEVGSARRGDAEHHRGLVYDHWRARGAASVRR